jgi:hypothetical protein
VTALVFPAPRHVDQGTGVPASGPACSPRCGGLSMAVVNVLPAQTVRGRLGSRGQNGESVEMAVPAGGEVGAGGVDHPGVGQHQPGAGVLGAELEADAAADRLGWPTDPVELDQAGRIPGGDLSMDAAAVVSKTQLSPLRADVAVGQPTRQAIGTGQIGPQCIRGKREDPLEAHRIAVDDVTALARVAARRADQDVVALRRGVTGGASRSPALSLAATVRDL